MADEQGERNNNYSSDRMSRPDSCENLDLSFDDLYIEDLMDANNSNNNNDNTVNNNSDNTTNFDPTDIQKPAKLSTTTTTTESTTCNAQDDEEDEDYILGTLIVRVVAARDLQSAGQPVGGAIGKLLFGNNGGSHHRSRRHYHHGHHSHGSYHRTTTSSSSTNPYASVRFGQTTQRTSQVYGTVDPIWPRGESMYMDVLVHNPRRYCSAVSTTATAATRGASKPIMSYGSDEPPAATVTKTSVAVAATAAASNRSKPDPSAEFAQKPFRAQEQKDEHQKHHSYSKPVLTVAIFHANNNNTKQQPPKYPTTKKGGTCGGDSDDQFLGMTAVDLTWLLTGKIRTLDEWLPLSGSNSDRACVRIVCEYEPSDAPLSAGDWVRFTEFCHPADLYPFHANQLYRVVEEQEASSSSSCHDNNSVLISYTSPEGWVSTVQVHRYMLFCEERHPRAAVEVYQDELTSLQQRIAHSPMVNVVQETVQRLPDEGFIGVGVDAVRGGASLLTRWIEGGVGTALNDVVFATNWDGRFNPDAATTLSTTSFESEEEEDDGGSQQQQRQQDAMYADASIPAADTEEDLYPDIEPLPNMPHCPITGEPMRDPVVAADGHTYERSAIARWLKSSDKSPLTGSILPHKNLVPNYMLLSSLSEAATTSSSSTTTAAVATAKPPPPSSSLEEEDDDDVTAEVKIDD